MQNIIHRKSITRLCALVLALMLLFSCTAGYAAASFTTRGAGVKYKGRTFRLDARTTMKTLKKAFGKSCKHNVDDGCVFGVATHEYIFKSKGVRIETLEDENGNQTIITIEISKKTVPTIGGLKVGDKVSKILKKYGRNCKTNGSAVLYTNGSYNMKVQTKKKKVTKIIIWKDL